MKKLNTYIDYGKFALVVILALIGSMTELNIPALIFLSAALITVCGLEVYMIRLRHIYYEKYEAYLDALDRAVKSVVRDSENAA